MGKAGCPPKMRRLNVSSENLVCWSRARHTLGSGSGVAAVRPVPNILASLAAGGGLFVESQSSLPLLRAHKSRHLPSWIVVQTHPQHHRTALPGDT